MSTFKDLQAVIRYSKAITQEMKHMTIGSLTTARLNSIQIQITENHKYFQELKMRSKRLKRDAERDGRGVYANKFRIIAKQSEKILYELDMLYNKVNEKYDEMNPSRT